MSSESRWSRGHRSAGAFLSELLTEHPVEGAQVVAQELSKHLKGSHGYDVVGRQQAPGDHLALLNGRAVGLRALAWLLRRRPPQVVYMPSSGLTPAAVARTMLIRLVSCKATVELVVTQVHMVASLQQLSGAILATFGVALTVTTEKQRQLLASRQPVRLLAPRVPVSKLSSLTYTEAREKLGWPDGVRVFMHVGHAKKKRNLHLLTRLTSFGDVVIVLSDAFPDESGSVPQGDGVTVLRGLQGQLSDLYRAADVYVFPTQAEDSVIGIPMSVMEALGNGTPVVAMMSEALARWSDTDGIQVCSDENEFVETVRIVSERGAGAKTSVGHMARPNDCHGDFFACQEK